MFTGIIEVLGEVVAAEKKNGNISFHIKAAMTSELRIGQSIAHNGVCLTVEKLDRKKKTYKVTAIRETLSLTNLGQLKAGKKVNLERALRAGDRLDGHFVQGHVDGQAAVKEIRTEKGSHLFRLELINEKKHDASLLIRKGSICIDGVSLTLVDVKKSGNGRPTSFSVAIIPHTFRHTCFYYLKKGDRVNVEFDLLGKYILNKLSLK